MGTVVQYRAVRDDIDVRELLLRWTFIDWLHPDSPEAAENAVQGEEVLVFHYILYGEGFPPPLCRFRTVRVPQVADSGGSSRLWGERGDGRGTDPSRPSYRGPPPSWAASGSESRRV